MFYVYVYYHPETGVPFYVGKGKGDRDKYHLRNKNTHYNDGMRYILQELDRKGQQPIIEHVLETDDERVAYEEECNRISLFGRIDLGTGTLHNRTPGGEGYGNSGKKWSDDQRQKRRKTFLKKSVGASYDQYTIEGKFIRRFTNSEELKQSGFSVTQIMAIRVCCKGKRFSVDGLRWCYAGSVLPSATTLMKRVIQSSKCGDLIKEYISVAAASESTGINAGDIASVARGNTRMKSAGGFLWRYID
jgi:hypothetical protein